MNLENFWAILAGIANQMLGWISHWINFILTYPIPPTGWIALAVVFCVGAAALAGRR